MTALDKLIMKHSKCVSFYITHELHNAIEQEIIKRGIKPKAKFYREALEAHLNIKPESSELVNKLAQAEQARDELLDIGDRAITLAKQLRDKLKEANKLP